MLASGLAPLLLGFAVLTWEGIRELEIDTAERATLAARLLAGTSTPALAFRDARSASELLQHWAEVDPDINYALIRDEHGARLADFRRSGVASPLGASGADSNASTHWLQDEIEIAQPIVVHGHPLGAVYMRASTAAMAERIRRHLVIVCMVGATVVALTALFAITLQRRISIPIARVAEVARRLATSHDLSDRAPKTSDDEIGDLADGFNHMMAALEQRKEERDRAEVQLREAIAARDEFLQVASHELKSPLAPVTMNIASALAHLQTQPANPGRASELLTRASLQTARLGRIIDEMGDVAFLVRGRLKLEREPVDLGVLVQEVSARFAEPLRRAGSPLSLHVREGVVGSWDRARLEQVVTNLLSNAVKFGEGRPVELRVESDADSAHLSVQDHGIGIPLEHQARVFGRFERVTSGARHEGLGIGLWMVHEIVESLGGRVHVESMPGAGATFFVDLPLHDATGARMADAAAGPALRAPL